MRFISGFLFISVLAVLPVSAQTNSPTAEQNLEKIALGINNISKSLEEFNEKLSVFSQTFTSNQGLRLSENQQRILFIFELLNRAESRLSTLKLLKIQLVEKESTTRRKITQIDEALRPENLDRSISGSLDAEKARNLRRQTLTKERDELAKLADEIEISIRETDREIRETEYFLRTIRQKLFPEIVEELENKKPK